MNQRFLLVARLVVLCLLFGTTQPAFAQFVRQQIQYSSVSSEPAWQKDSIYTIKYHWFQSPKLQKGEERTRFFRSMYSARYAPELKSKFSAYPMATKELAVSERYYLKSTRWMQLAVTSSLAALAFTIAARDNPNFDKIDLGLTAVTLGAIIPGVFYSVRSNEHRENAVKHLNLRQ